MYRLLFLLFVVDISIPHFLYTYSLSVARRFVNFRLLFTNDAAAEANVVFVKYGALARGDGFDFFVKVERVVFESRGN